MQKTYTSVLARRVHINDDFATLPYEAGWASEGVFFVQAEKEHPALEVSVEVSPDGINWIRRGTPVVLAANASIAELPVAMFGNWLRVTITGASPDAGARILVHLNLKG